MENKTYTQIQNLPSNSNLIIPTTTITPNTFVLSPSTNKTTTITTPSLQTLQAVPVTRPINVYSDNNNRSSIIITQPTYNKLLGETVKQEQFEDNSVKQKKTKSKPNNIQPSTVINSIHFNPRETLNGLSAIPMSLANLGNHLTPTLNPTHLSDGTGQYFVSSLSNDLTSNYKLPPSSNADLPSPSTSSNSSNPPSSNHHHQGKRHGESGNPTQKRAMRLQKNREAARECRRKKKEYIKCLEERVTGLENQNKALIEELRQLKELYCQREVTNNNNTNNKTATTTR